MIKRKNWMAASIASVAVGSLVLAVPSAKADLFGSLFKGGLVAAAIHQFNRPLNDAINRLTGSAGASNDQATKVVPIVSVGQGSYAGAAQVSGPSYLLNQVQAVGMIEGSLAGKEFRMKALVPISTDHPGSRGLSRVKGVGVSAIIDIHV